VAIVVKLTPAGDVRAIIFTPEFERDRARGSQEPPERPKTFPGPAARTILDENQPAGAAPAAAAKGGP
jgi:hypothetical protein